MGSNFNSDSLEVLLRFSQEYWAEIRHIEGQRAAIANLVLIIASVSVGLMSQKGSDFSSVPIATLVIFSGLYGVVTTAKLHERYRFLQNRLDRFYDKINESVPEAEFNQIREVAAIEHRRAFPYLSRLPLHRLWSVLHLAVALLGALFLVIR